MQREAELAELVLGSDWLTNLLRLVAALDLPDCWIGAGAVRDFVWDTRFGSGFDPDNIEDVDVVFFDPSDLTAEHEREIERPPERAGACARLGREEPARVHLWYEARFGQPAEPLTSTTDGVSTWPETATAIAVRLRADGSLDVAAPLGLDDLLDGVWRRNSRRVTDAEYQARIDRKQPRLRWPVWSYTRSYTYAREETAGEQRRDEDPERQRSPVREVQARVPEEQHQQPRRREGRDEEDDGDDDERFHGFPPVVSGFRLCDSDQSCTTAVRNTRSCTAWLRELIAAKSRLGPPKRMQNTARPAARRVSNGAPSPRMTRSPNNSLPTVRPVALQLVVK